jgi:nucleotide-binding universal stress UspA family protein
MSGIIVGVDGSDGSRLALDWALEEGRAHGLPVKIIHAWMGSKGGGHNADRTGGMSPGSSAAALAQQMRDDAQIRHGEITTVRAVTTVIQGDPRVVLAASAERSAADLLVVGSRGATGPLVRFFLGSTATYLAHHPPCPLTIVPVDQSE